MPRFAKKRDENEILVFKALKVAGREPIRCTDFDIAASHVLGYGIMLEVKRDSKAKLRPIQKALQRLFRERYIRVNSVEQALIACGIAL